MKSPAFQFYASDFIVGVMGMSDDEVGIYIKMLAFQWVKGGLPIEPTGIKKLIGSRKIPTDAVMEKFTLCEDGMLRNDRLEIERGKQASFRESRSENAKKRWKKESTSNARASGSTSTVHAVSNALQSSSSSSSSDYSPPTPKKAGESVGGMEALKSRINGLKAEWAKPVRWSYAEDQHLFNGSAAQMEEMAEEDWKLIGDYLSARMPQGSNYWQPRNRDKFAETFANTWADAQRWAGNIGRVITPKQKDGVWK